MLSSLLVDPGFVGDLPQLTQAIGQQTNFEIFEVTSLRNKALDCLSLICEGIGKEVAGADADGCLQLILMAQVRWSLPTPTCALWRR